MSGSGPSADSGGGSCDRVDVVDLVRDNLQRVRTEQPDVALTVARKSMEALIDCLRHDLGLPHSRNRKSLLDDLVTHLPQSVLDACRIVQICGNYGSHNQEPVVPTVPRHLPLSDHHQLFRNVVLPCLEGLLEWYQTRRQRVQQGEASAVRAYLESLQRLSRGRRGDQWIPPEVKRGPQTTDFDVVDWARGSEHVLYVTGEFGVGKTTYCHVLVEQISGALLTGRLHGFLPVVAELRDGAVSAQELARLGARSNTTVVDLVRTLAPDAEALRLIESRYVLLVEGLDELSEESARTLLSTLCACLLNNEAGHKVIVSSRINCLRLHTRRLAQSAAKKFLYDPMTNALAIQLFDATRVDQYLARRFSSEMLAALRKAIQAEPRLRTLACRPLLLQMLTADSPSALEELVGLGRQSSTNELELITMTWLFEHIAGSAWSGLPTKTATAIGAAMGSLAYDLLTDRISLLSEQHVSAALRASGVVDADGLGLYAVVRSPFIMAAGAGRLKFTHWSYCEFFGAKHLQDLGNLQTAIKEHPGRLQELFCHRGIVDFLREMVGSPHAALLNHLLSSGQEDAVAFSSHLMRRGIFKSSLAQLEEAFRTARTDQARIYLVFAILTHLKFNERNWVDYVEFVSSHREELRWTLLEYVDGVEADVAVFSSERLLAVEHRSKAVLYLLSLSDPAIWRTDRARVRDAVRNFLEMSSPSRVEAQFADEILRVTS